MANALLVLALPVILGEAFKIIRSLHAAKEAARDIARSVQAVSAAVPPTMTTLGDLANLCQQLEEEVVACPSPV